MEIRRRFEAEMERLQIIDAKFYFEIDLLQNLHLAESN